MRPIKKRYRPKQLHRKIAKRDEGFLIGSPFKKKGDPSALYLLRDRVDIDPVLEFEKTVNDYVKKIYQQVLQAIPYAKMSARYKRVLPR